MTNCDNCKYSVQDWTNPNNPDHYCRNEENEIWTSWKDADWYCADAERQEE